MTPFFAKGKALVQNLLAGEAMSGKKSWEVANVLNQAESIRDEIFSSYKETILEGIEQIDKYNETILETQKKIQNYELKQDPIMQKELPKPLEHIREQLRSLQEQSKRKTPYQAHIFTKRLNDIDASITQLNMKSNILREKLKQNSSHYKDAEYNQANQIKNEIETSKQYYRTLKSDIDGEKNNTRKIYEWSISSTKDLSAIEKNLTDLKQKAQQIKMIRTKANELKSDIVHSAEDIDKSKAMKFSQQAFEEITKKAESFQTLSNEEVISQHSMLSSQIETLKIDYTQAYHEWLSRKTYTQTLLDELSTQGSMRELIRIEDQVEGRDARISKLAYIDHYQKSNRQEEFERSIQEARRLFKQEVFESCNQQLYKIQAFLQVSSNDADDLRENIEASTQLTLKIREIMLSDAINFKKAHIELIDNNPLNGLRLECKNGDTINFEKIKIDKEHIDIQLDHIENTAGGCGVRWKDMQRVFNENGIPLTDVIKNNTSVIYKDLRDAKTNLKEQAKEAK